MRKIASLLIAAVLIAIGSAPVAAQCPAVAALADTERRVTYSISAATGPYDVAFPVLGDGVDAGAWLQVWLDGVLLVYTTDWTFSLASGTVATACRPITNGRVTLVSPGTGTLEIVGARRPRRTTQFTQNQGITARTFNQHFTDLTAQLREVWDLRARMLIGVPGDTFGPLPAKSDLAGTVLGFDADGNPMAGAIGVSAIAVSAYIGTLLDDVDAAAARATLGLTVGSNIQAWDADLDAIAALGGTGGFAARTAANTWALRTLTGTANEITVTNGDGIAGAPTFSLPAALTFTGKTITGGTYADVAALSFPSAAVISWASSDVTLTHSSNALVFAGASVGYGFSGGPIVPTTNDGLALGLPTQSFSDLYLASGGIIGWANGTYTITQSGTNLAFLGSASFGANGGTGGSTKLFGATSGDATIRVPAAAGTATIFQLPATNGTANYHLITDGSGNTSWAAPATDSEIWSATSGKRVDAAGLNSAGQMVALTPGTNVAVNMALGVNFTLAMGGNYTLDAPTNTQAGRSGCIFITQDGGGSRTLVYASAWKFAGGIDPVLTTTGGATDMLCYVVMNSTNIMATFSADMQ